jgi:small subunit ribosomal protein S9
MTENTENTETVETVEVAQIPASEGITLGGVESTATEVAPIHVSRGPDAHGWFRGTGRRKSSVARVRIKPGKGEFLIHGAKKGQKPLDTYFTEIRDRNAIRSVLEKTGTAGSVDVFVNADGGGFTGQSGAIILGVARALREFDPALEPALRENGFLTRDAREVERKKYGQPGARRQFQFSKR